MIEIPDPSTRELIYEALRSDNPGALTWYRLTVAGKEYENASVSTESEEDRIGLALTAEIPERLPRSLGGEPVTLDILIAGEEIRRFTGSALRPKSSGPSTQLIANTGGYWLEKIRIGTTYSFTDEEPYFLALRALQSMPYTGQLDIQRVRTPKISRAGEDALSEMDKHSDVMEAVEEEADMTFADTYHNGCRGSKVLRDYEQASPVWTFYVGEDLDGEDFEFDEASSEYSEIVCYREVENVGLEILARADIPGSTAPPGAALEIEITAVTNAHEDAQTRLYDALTEEMSPRGEGSAKLPWVHPLLEDGDVIEVVQPLYSFREDVIERRIVAEIVGQTVAMPAKEHELSLRGRIVEERTREPVPIQVESPPPVSEPEEPPIGNTWGELESVTWAEAESVTWGELE